MTFKWPDLILPAYDFREAQLRQYKFQHTTEYANGRCKIRIGGYEDEQIPEDLPMLHFEKECLVCEASKKGINLCPECWHRIRKCLPQKHHLGGVHDCPYGKECFANATVEV